MSEMEFCMDFSKKLIGSTSSTLILAVIGEQDRHGYSIVQRVNELSGGSFQWCEGTIYPSLHRLEKQGLLSGRWTKSPSGHRRRVYSLTQSGRDELEEQSSEWSSFASTVDQVLRACHAT
ncbi:MAG: PadR family transcriptional regulator [Planctomycetota bacterium]